MRFASNHTAEGSQSHPYESHFDQATEDDSNRKNMLPGLKESTSQYSQSNLSKPYSKQARSASRQFFSKRPKTVQQFIEFNSNKQNKIKNNNKAALYESSEFVQQDLGSLEGISENITSVFGNQDSMFKYQNHSTFKEALQKQIESQNSLSMLQKGQQQAQNQQTQINQKLLKKQIDHLKLWLDEKEFDFENNYGISQYDADKLAQDKKNIYKELLGIYEEGIQEFIQKIVKKSTSQQLLLERLVGGIKFSYKKLAYFNKLDLNQHKVEIKSLNKELEQLNSKNLQLQNQIFKEERYLSTMFEKSNKDGLGQMVDDWENMKSLADQIKDSNLLSTMFQKSNSNIQDDDLPSSERKRQQADYSGVILQLRDLYHIMNNHVKYEQGDFQIDVKSEAIVDKIQSEMTEKFKNVQNATAKKVLSRFYRKIVLVDSSTQVEEDPFEIERRRFEKIIENLRNERDKDFQRMSIQQSQLDQLNKSLNTLQTQYREAKTQLSLTIDQVEQKEGEIKETKSQFRYLNEQLFKFQEQVKELMNKCDDYEMRVEMYREGHQRLEKKTIKRRIKLNLAVEEKIILEKKIKELEFQINDLKYQVKKSINYLEPPYEPRRKPVMVKKPIFDADGKIIGEAFVEELKTVRSESSNYFQSGRKSASSQSDQKSDYSLDTQDREELKKFLEEQGETINEFKEVSKDEFKSKIDGWFKGPDKRRPSLSDLTTSNALAEQFKQKMKQAKKSKKLSQIQDKESIIKTDENNTDKIEIKVIKEKDQSKEQDKPVIIKEKQSEKTETKQPKEEQQQQFLSVNQSKKQEKADPKIEKKELPQTKNPEPKQPTSDTKVKKSLKPNEEKKTNQTKPIQQSSPTKSKEIKEQPPSQKANAQVNQLSKSQSPVKESVQISTEPMPLQKQGTLLFQSQLSQQYDSPKEPVIKISQKSREDLGIDYQNTSLDQSASRNNIPEQSQSQFQQILRKHTLLSKGSLNHNQVQQSEDIFSQSRSRGGSTLQQLSSFKKTNQVQYNSKHAQTEITGEIIAKPKINKNGNTMQTQTEEYMFPMDEELKKKVMEIIGGKLAKYGDQYDKGSSFFTKAAQLIDEIEGKYQINDGISKVKAANGLIDPRYKSFKPVLGKIKQPKNY